MAWPWKFVKSRARSLKTVPFESLGTHNTVPVTLSCIISEIKRDIGRKSRLIPLPASDVPVKEVHVGLLQYRNTESAIEKQQCPADRTCERTLSLSIPVCIHSVVVFHLLQRVCDVADSGATCRDHSVCVSCWSPKQQQCRRLVSQYMYGLPQGSVWPFTATATTDRNWLGLGVKVSVNSQSRRVSVKVNRVLCYG